MDNKQSFESYLAWRHSSIYEGFDDDMPEAFEKWLDDLNVDEWLVYAESWKKTLDHNLSIKENILLNRVTGRLDLDKAFESPLKQIDGLIKQAKELKVRK